MIKNSKQQFLERIRKIHVDCHKLCQQAFGRYYRVAGNVGIFCQSDEEYETFNKLRHELCEPSDNPDQKYYKLINPIIIPAENHVPEAIYTRLYIRKPDPTPYGKNLGDIDFVTEDYLEIKNRLLNGENFKGAEFYDRPGWDTVQITDPVINSVAYLSTQDFAKKVWVKF